MKKIIVLCFIAMILMSCDNQNISSKETISDDLNSSSNIDTNNDNPINSILDTSAPIDVLDISSISRSSIINVAWKDRENIFFITRTFPQWPQNSQTVGDYPIEIYRYDYKKQSIEKVFEYFSKENYPYLYIQVQDNGDLALKHSEGFTIVSTDDYSIKSEIKMPKDDYVNYNISYDGSKIALAHAEQNELEILEASSLDILESMKIENVGYIQAPLWTTDGNAVILFTPQREFVDMVAVYNLTDTRLYQYNFSKNIDSYDNEAYLSNNANYVFRTDSIGDETNLKIVVYEYNLNTEVLDSWSFASPMPMYCKSISEKGYLVGHVYHYYHQLYFGDLNNRVIIKTENAKSGGAKYPPIWAQNQEEAIALFTLEGDEKSNIKWGAAILDVKSMTKGKEEK